MQTKRHGRPMGGRVARYSRLNYHAKWAPHANLGDLLWMLHFVYWNCFAAARNYHAKCANALLASAIL